MWVCLVSWFGELGIMYFRPTLVFLAIKVLGENIFGSYVNWASIFHQFGGLVLKTDQVLG